MRMAVFWSWTFMHLLAMLLSGGLVLANMVKLKILQDAENNMIARKTNNGYIYSQLRIGRTSAVVRVGGHASYALVALLSLSVGTGIISARLGTEEIWTYILPVMIAFNMNILFFGTLTVLGLISARRIYAHSFDLPGPSPVSENSSKIVGRSSSP